ncbi:unnamed protein product [Closterium sp. NIES-64]|nr:unnamed protein product [Closterium sp. NIES-64]
MARWGCYSIPYPSNLQPPPLIPLAGLLSCLATNPFMPGLLAMGSYDGSVGLYGDLGREAMAVMHGHTGGVTQVLFSRDGNFLYSGARKVSPSLHIVCWHACTPACLHACTPACLHACLHVCMPACLHACMSARLPACLHACLHRCVTSTNQRIAFDIDPSNRHLATGGEDGQVWVYDLASGSKIAAFQAAQDTINGFAFHPCLPLAATSSGHRRFHLPPPLTPASPPEADNCSPEAPAIAPEEGHVSPECALASHHKTSDRLHSECLLATQSLHGL